MNTIQLETPCIDCHAHGTVHYVLGAVRCQQCAETFNAANHAERVRLANLKATCADCGEEYFASEACRDCCDHEYDSSEGFTCLNCGKEGAEEVLSAAFDRAKDRRKYGC